VRDTGSMAMAFGIITTHPLRRHDELTGNRYRLPVISYQSSITLYRELSKRFVNRGAGGPTLNHQPSRLRRATARQATFN